MVDPKVAVVIPTYNRRELLWQTLFQFTQQRPGTPSFEVIVSDDGSSDDSASVVRYFEGAIPLKYHFQEDNGNRVALARNAGARLASAPILVFLDSGTLPGPDFVRQHAADHENINGPCAVAGYAYGYDPDRAMPGLADMVKRCTPEETVRHLGREPGFLDPRDKAFPDGCEPGLSHGGRESSRDSIEWKNFWSINCSMRADDFWAVGGFDEDHRGWAVEDIDLGYRLFRYGVPIVYSRAAWVVEPPHPRNRDRETELSELRTNMTRFLSLHPDSAIEVGWARFYGYLSRPWRVEHTHLLRYRAQVRDLDVADEIRHALREAAHSTEDYSAAIIGAGGSIPDMPGRMTLLDFDDSLLRRSLRDGQHVGYNLIGLRVPLADQSADVAVITSRVIGMWPHWGNRILDEAHRIARNVICCGSYA